MPAHRVGLNGCGNGISDPRSLLLSFAPVFVQGIPEYLNHVELFISRYWDSLAYRWGRGVDSWLAGCGQAARCISVAERSCYRRLRHLGPGIDGLGEGGY